MSDDLRKETVDAVNLHDQDLVQLDQQRKRWLIASSFVYSAIIILIFTWDWLDGLGEKSVWWVVVSLMLVLSINWWYLTMRMIRRFMNHRSIEVGLILNIMEDLREIKQDVKKLKNSNDENLGDR